MITSVLGGGLGNQMFKISAAISLAYDNDDITVFDFNNYHGCSQGFSPFKYRNNIFRKLVKGVIESPIQYKDLKFNYTKIDYKNNLELDGLFQTEKYFVNNKQLILDLFEISQEIKNKLDIYKRIFNVFNKTTVSLHVRRGDYLPIYNTLPSISLEYINNALSYFENCLVCVISDDINWCIGNIKSTTSQLYFIGDNLEDYEQLYLMSMCDHNIIANSSFSWWGSYLNLNPDKMVIAPKLWFGSDFHEDWNDIYYEKNIII